MIHLRQVFVRVVRAGNLALENVAGAVGRGNGLAQDIQRRGIKTRGRYSVARKGRGVQWIDRELRGLGEDACPLIGRGDNSRVDERCGDLPQP